MDRYAFLRGETEYFTESNDAWCKVAGKMVPGSEYYLKSKGVPKLVASLTSIKLLDLHDVLDSIRINLELSITKKFEGPLSEYFKLGVLLNIYPLYGPPVSVCSLYMQKYRTLLSPHGGIDIIAEGLINLGEQV